MKEQLILHDVDIIDHLVWNKFGLTFGKLNSHRIYCSGSRFSQKQPDWVLRHIYSDRRLVCFWFERLLVLIGTTMFYESSTFLLVQIYYFDWIGSRWGICTLLYVRRSVSPLSSRSILLNDTLSVYRKQVKVTLDGNIWSKCFMAKFDDIIHTRDFARNV